MKTLVGYNATFECESVGIPTPKVTWSKKVGNTLQVLINSRRHVITSDALYIYNVTYGDEAEYICDSESPRLRKSKSGFLDVYGNYISFAVNQEGIHILSMSACANMHQLRHFVEFIMRQSTVYS